jgi:hypothetical protein
MTLIELMIGLVITSLAVAAGYAAFASIVDHQQRVHGTSDEVTRTAAVRRTLTNWLENAQLQISSGDVPSNGMTRDLNSSQEELRFITTAPTPLYTDSTIVDLYVNTNAADPRRGLVALLTRSQSTDSMLVQLDSTVTAMSVLYLTGETAGRQWLDAASLGNTTPVAVRLALLSTEDPSTHSLLWIPITLPVHGGTS